MTVLRESSSSVTVGDFQGRVVLAPHQSDCGSYLDLLMVSLIKYYSVLASNVSEVMKTGQSHR
jgi:hypothetical protein